ncbi:imidazole glycerol phosphate synthase subunit HisH [Mucilaginibacter ginkgonis]|uniref:Imidazole glycerol phosphate synthase subunit HisH n=1 Tax=Mucilaginibacter ginkgonis TaxID=2682091 RepID=A0A6I4I6V0_9SPHI|nr:imidazole glycerol phosphate synthase subunit HisH [Mucilaginibacter ginkgonis]QQL50849.1 imidazole glycerol phosphate synthase subunit HisH [Mucilaginibacter ginkgonis]
MITIVDYGLGNLGSIKNMLKKVGSTVEITDDLEKIERAEKLILPGVGAFDDGMSKLHERGLTQLLNKKVLEDKTPILGVCLGMQLMTQKSEEGSLSGLGWIEGEAKKFTVGSDDQKLRIPHMGWNVIKPEDGFQSGIFSSKEEELRFYFVHSFYVELKNAKEVAAYSNYGKPFVSAFKKDNIYGMQFHPEKSHRFGMDVFKNFVNI